MAILTVRAFALLLVATSVEAFSGTTLSIPPDQLFRASSPLPPRILPKHCILQVRGHVHARAAPMAEHVTFPLERAFTTSWWCTAWPGKNIARLFAKMINRVQKIKHSLHLARLIIAAGACCH
jgi:hypothetical protein